MTLTITIVLYPVKNIYAISQSQLFDLCIMCPALVAQNNSQHFKHVCFNSYVSDSFGFYYASTFYNRIQIIQKALAADSAVNYFEPYQLMPIDVFT